MLAFRRRLRVLVRPSARHHLLGTVRPLFALLAAHPAHPPRAAHRNYCGEFDNFGAVMSVSLDLLCSFELLKVRRRLVPPFPLLFPRASFLTQPLVVQPLDTAQLKRELAKTRRRLSSSASAASAT